MKTYSNDILGTIINRFNGEFLTLKDFNDKMIGLGFVNCQSIPEKCEGSELIYHLCVDGKWVEVYIHYLPTNIKLIATFKEKVKAYSKLFSIDNLEDIRSTMEYKELEDVYTRAHIKVQFMYVQED